jgi:hypothetical protein
MIARILPVLILVVAAAGCQVTPWPMRMFQTPEKTTYRTAQMRMDAVRDFRSKATGVDTPEQREIVNQLARQIQVEPDPLVREAIVDTIAEFRTPLAAQVLEAGLADDDLGVRRHSCQALGRRGDPAAVPVLARVLNDEKDIDVRLAAVKALGDINSPDAYTALAVAMEDRDPAMQYAGVQSMKAISGKDFGGNVSTWVQYAKGQAPQPTEGAETSVARRLRDLAPF